MFEFDFRRTPVTLVIAAVAIALEVVSTFDDSRRIAFYYDYQMGIWSHIWLGELWRPFTSTLLHGDLLHAGFNVFLLLLFGTALEREIGSARYAGIVVLLGYIPMLVQFVVNGYWIYWTDAGRSMAHIVGLSGVGYGLFGIMLVARRHRSEYQLICNDTTVRILLGWLVICVVLTWLGVMPVANLAHASGLGLGWLIGSTLFDQKHRVGWAIATTAVSIAVLSTLIACPGHPGYEDAMRVRQWRARHPEQSRVRSPQLPCCSAPIGSVPTCSATNSRTTATIGPIDSSRPVSTSRTRGQSSDRSSDTRRSPSANEKV